MELQLIEYEELDNLPNMVYKYRSWSNDFHKEIISDQVVFMARPSSFEDALECKLQRRYDLMTADDIYKKYLQDSQQTNPHLTLQQHKKNAIDWFKKSPLRDKEYIENLAKQSFLEFDDRIGILSLTANPKLTLMWDKYADQHKGFCVGFDTNKMFEKLGGGGKVNYYEKLPDISAFDSIEEEYIKQVYSKEVKWNFEEEYRTIKFYPKSTNVEERKIKLAKECYKQIIFGANQPEIQKREIIDICKKEKLEIDFLLEKIDSDGEITIEKTDNTFH